MLCLRRLRSCPRRSGTQLTSGKANLLIGKASQNQLLDETIFSGSPREAGTLGSESHSVVAEDKPCVLLRWGTGTLESQGPDGK